MLNTNIQGGRSIPPIQNLAIRDWVMLREKEKEKTLKGTQGKRTSNTTQFTERIQNAVSMWLAVTQGIQ